MKIFNTYHRITNIPTNQYVFNGVAYVLCIIWQFPSIYRMMEFKISLLESFVWIPNISCLKEVIIYKYLSFLFYLYLVSYLTSLLYGGICILFCASFNSCNLLSRFLILSSWLEIIDKSFLSFWLLLSSSCFNFMLSLSNCS